MRTETLSLLHPEAEAQECLEGVLEHITFLNPSNGFLVGRFSQRQDETLCTVCGRIGIVRAGESLRLWGHWQEHPRYGAQFSVQNHLIVEPNTLFGVERYLATQIDGLGGTLAKRIVEKFGLETFRVIDAQPQLLLKIPRFPRKVLKTLHSRWELDRARRGFLVFLHGVGIPAGYAERIQALYGADAERSVRVNPYRLASEIHGIGFHTADLVARRLGLAEDSPQRAEAGIRFLLEMLQGQGHTGCPYGLLITRATESLSLPQNSTLQGVDVLRRTGWLRALKIRKEDACPQQTSLNHPNPHEETAATEQNREQQNAAPHGTEDEKIMLFSPRMERAERSIVENLLRVMGGEATLRPQHIPKAITRLERTSGILLSEDQKRAVSAALEHKALILTGGPGTGKTTIIRFMLELFSGNGSVALAAPTGKAARHMTEAAGREARTLHRLLEAGPKGFGRNRENPLEAALVIVDECSMLDTQLMRALLEALPSPARLVLVGDVDQLPSVGPGRVLQDLIDWGRLPLVRLEYIFRQAHAGRIIANAHAVRRGQMPNLDSPSETDRKDFYFVEQDDAQRAAEILRQLVTQRIPKAFGFDPRHEIQVLSPMHAGASGVHQLNEMLQLALNPHGEAIPFSPRPLHVGDRVIQIRNDYEKEVFNGEIGLIAEQDRDSEQVQIEFDGRVVRYERNDLEYLNLGYAITVHKAQGSEYPAVVLPLLRQHTIMLQRNLLYTAITRAQKLVVIIGSRQAVRRAVFNARPVVRHTGLLQRLQNLEASSTKAARLHERNRASAYER